MIGREPSFAFGSPPPLPTPIGARAAPAVDSQPASGARETAVDAARGPRDPRTVPMAVFVAVLGVLLATALVSLFLPGTVVEGLPRDPSARAARDLMYGQVMPPCDGMRFRSVFLGELSPALHPHSPDAVLLARGEALLMRSHEAHPLEPRVVAGLGHLELAFRHLERAAALYRRAIELRAHCSEARLGLGVALALQSERAGDPFRRRALALEALSQFTAVSPESELAWDALYDRALMLERVGRRTAARALAGRYLASEPGGPWADRLRAELHLAR